MPLSPLLLHKLNDALLHRRVNEGFLLAQKFNKDIARLNSSDLFAAPYLLCLAQWVDVGYRNVAFLNDLIARFLDVPRAQLQFSDYINLRMVEGYRAFASEDATSAIPIFDFILQVEPVILDLHIRTLAHFWKARAHRQLG